MIITRNGVQIELTPTEVAAAHREFVECFMQEILEQDFNVPVVASKEWASRAYDIYTDVEDMTEYEAVADAAKEYWKQIKEAIMLNMQYVLKTVHEIPESDIATVTVRAYEIYENEYSDGSKNGLDAVRIAAQEYKDKRINQNATDVEMQL